MKKFFTVICALFVVFNLFVYGDYAKAADNKPDYIFEDEDNNYVSVNKPGATKTVVCIGTNIKKGEYTSIPQSLNSIIYAHPYKVLNAPKASSVKCFEKSGGVYAIIGKKSVAYIGTSDWNKETIVIPDKITYNNNTYDVTEIGNYAFYGNEHIKKVLVGDKVKKIGDFSFVRCINLIYVKLGKNVDSIGYKAFGGCVGLKKITLNNNLTTIKMEAFSNCRKLTKIKLGKNIESIGDYAFRKCKSLKEIEILKKEGVVSKTLFSKNLIELNKKISIKVPQEMLESYRKLYDKCENRYLKVSITQK